MVDDNKSSSMLSWKYILPVCVMGAGVAFFALNGGETNPALPFQDIQPAAGTAFETPVTAQESANITTEDAVEEVETNAMEMSSTDTDTNVLVDETASQQPPVLRMATATLPETDSIADVSVERNGDDETTADMNQEPKVDYNTVLSFPITEEKMKSFVMAADKIDKVNRKWDMLISGADTDTMAVEYITLSNEEMAEVMGSISTISVDEYNEIFALAAKNDDFRAIVNAFKQYYVVAQKRDGNLTQTSNSDNAAN